MIRLRVTTASVAVSLAVAINITVLTLLWPFTSRIRLELGLGKTIQPISDFPYQCTRIFHPLLQSCGDMWLSRGSRQLYLACGDFRSRARWFPPAGNYNITARSTKDAIVVLEIDQPGLIPHFPEFGGPVTAQRLVTPGFSGTLGDGLLDLNGFTGVDMGNVVIRLLVVNNRPSVDSSTGTYAEDQATVGANSTIEVFEHAGRGHDFLSHLLTVVSPKITTPNRPAAFGTTGFYITNDHGPVKTGKFFQLKAKLGKGDVTFCSYTDGCRVVSAGHSHPSGLAHSHGHLYVPSSASGGLRINRSHQDGSLAKVADIDAPYAMDNLATDGNGVTWAAASPRGYRNGAYAKNPVGPVPPSTVLRIRLRPWGYEWKKMLEDRDGEVLPAASVVVYDHLVKRLFLGSAFSPFITMCYLPMEI
ncbi:hypothetical protein GE09DRAFT_1171434 [Coniochaeta sp. 2T2.1]|nr:hypothetical protein GE09DRAFT_1171434 [Coniochaeta sp. 2T2.1]